MLPISQVWENHSANCVYRNRMWSSAMHFAIGFFGYPFEGQYEQSITIENDGVSLWSLSIVSTDICRHQFNNTLAPEKTYVACNYSMHRCLMYPFSVVLMGMAPTSPTVPTGMFVAGSIGEFRPPFLLSCAVRPIRMQIPQGRSETSQRSFRRYQTRLRGCLCHANDVCI